MRYTRLWAAFALITGLSFAVLGYYGREIYRNAPPIPSRVVVAGGTTILSSGDINSGQNVWQSMGGQEVGSIWGHGAYVAPDWTADWIHREALLILNRFARDEFGRPFSQVGPEQQATLKVRLKRELRANTYNPADGTITVSPVRAEAIRALDSYYAAIFGGEGNFAPELREIADGGRTPAQLRSDYAIPANAVPDRERMRQMSAFFFWTAWAAVTQRPDQGNETSATGVSEPLTYTSNWPPEPLIDNRPGGAVVVWSVLSFVLLLAGIGALAWYHSVISRRQEPPVVLPEKDPLLALHPTPSMVATLKYFWVVALLLVIQVALGAVTAHYGVEGSGFYGFPLAKYLPYSVTRTWHTQLGIFWIATAWLATGLFMAPAVSGREPPYQRAGVNFLFVCLLIIVAGSMFGNWYATRQGMSHEMNFWFGHQGLEYVDLGRFWQLFLFVGLFVWLFLMGRALWPAFRQPGEHKHLLALFFVASTAIALFYGAGLTWGQHTNLAIIEYWRWWVVHLWVEGFFEVFATVVIAFLFTRMGLLNTATATSAVLFSTCIFLSGGIIGTFHHLYFTGTPTAILALGAVFSALEVVPLVLIGFEAYENLTLSRAKPWVTAYRWPIYFFVSVAFWNLVGAGLFGFLINPPIALYYMQGLNTTPVHGHTALFGVYGMLGIGLMLFCLKGLTVKNLWRTRWLSFSFWAINWGLALMVLLSVLPVGLIQTWASVNYGMWYARSAEFMQSGILNNLRWLRVIGDTIFAAGALALGWFVLGLKTGWSVQSKPEETLQER